MSAVPILSLHPATRESIEAQEKTTRDVWRCGCQQTRDTSRIWLCQFHDGFDAGAEAATR